MPDAASHRIRLLRGMYRQTVSLSAEIRSDLEVSTSTCDENATRANLACWCVTMPPVTEYKSAYVSSNRDSQARILSALRDSCGGGTTPPISLISGSYDFIIYSATHFVASWITFASSTKNLIGTLLR